MNTNPELIERLLWAWIENATEGVTRENVNPRVLDLNRHRAAAALSAVLPEIVQAAKAEALRELRDYLAEPRRVWFGDLGVRVALDIDDPRSHLALSAYLDLRADRIEKGES